MVLIVTRYICYAENELEKKFNGVYDETHH